MSVGLVGTYEKHKHVQAPIGEEPNHNEVQGKRMKGAVTPRGERRGANGCGLPSREEIKEQREMVAES